MAKSFVVIPAYNEGRNIGAVLQRLRDLASKMPLAVILVDDGSADNTREEAERIAPLMDLEIVAHPVNLGVPRTFHDGLAAAAARAEPGDCIFIIEGDGTSDLALMPEMTRRVHDGDDVVVASRYLSGGGYVNFPVRRTWGSYLVNFVLSIVFHVHGITDYTIFYRAYRAEVVQCALKQHGRDFITTRSFAANLEVFLRVLPFCARFSEVPLTYDYALKKSQSRMEPFKTLREYQALIVQRLFRRI
jgi:dolichol-phosphate mannosyltransferase